MQLHVFNSPFSEEQAELLNRLLPTLTDTQKIWLTGFIAASQAAGTVAAPVAAPVTTAPLAPVAPVVSKDVTILFGSQTGNAARLAKKAGQTLTEKGFNVTVSAMSDFKPANLKKVENLLIFASTHGEGTPPDNALSFHEFLFGKRAPKLEGLKYAVLSLGDSSYEFFCQTGKDFDERLEALGASRLHPRVDCDLDFEEPAAAWLEGVVAALGTTGVHAVSAVQSTATSVGTSVESAYSRTNPFRAEVLENLNLNGRGSNKETRHLELSLEGSGLTFQPGDSLGIFPENDPELVDAILAEMNWNASEQVVVNKQGETRSLREALVADFEITVLTKPLLEQAAKLSASAKLQELIAPEQKDALKEYMKGRDLLDLVREFGPWTGSAQDFVASLRKMPARLYSISSSLAANPDEVHLTIGAVRYEANGRKRNGVCSILTAERLQAGDTLPIFIQSNDGFKLPEDSEAPIIMVGPGTGVAPFRSFMQEREETGAGGKSWMFFGDQHFVTDFLYQTEWQKWLKDGVLTRMDVAFSRDTDEKVYVQHRMLERSGELFEWLEAGAYFYICGDEKNMAKDVHETLLQIIEKEGNKSRAEAEAYLANMQKDKRYQRDVY